MAYNYKSANDVIYSFLNRVLFASSVLNLCELVALRPDLNNQVTKVTCAGHIEIIS